MQTRRQFVVRGTKLVAVGAVAAAAGPTIFVRDAKADGQLKILQWSHFVPAYDKWFDPWAKEWGAKRGVNVTVDHVGFADVVPRATAEVAAQSGHDVHMFLGLASAFEEHVIDLADVVAALEKKYGKQVELAHRSTYNPFTKKQFALSDMWVPDPGNYHKEVWSKIGMENGPSTYDDLVISTRTWRCGTSSGATAAPFRTRTATSSSTLPRRCVRSNTRRSCTRSA